MEVIGTTATNLDHLLTYKLEYAKQSFYFSGVKNWNEIPNEIREKGSIARFKAEIRDYLMNLKSPNTTHW